MRAGFGTGKIIFPRKLFPLEGFSGAVHDDPYVRTAVLETESGTVAVVVFELVNVPEEMIMYAREQACIAFDIPGEQVMVHMTHAITTPHEPRLRPALIGDEEKEKEVQVKKALFQSALRTAVNESVSQAAGDREDVRVGIGCGACTANQNRDVKTPWGWWIGVNGDGYTDKRMTVLKVENMEGTVKGLLVHYPMKPCAVDNSEMKMGTRQISSEVCGIACKRLEADFGAPVIYLMGAAANQIPFQVTLVEKVVDGKVISEDEGVDKGFQYADKTAVCLEKAVLSIENGINCTEREVSVEWRRASFLWNKRKSSGKRILTKSIVHESDGEGEFPYEIVSIGDLAFVLVKPEMNALTGKELREQSPFTHTLLCTMCNGEMKYVPDLDSYNNHTWEAQSSFFMPGAAEKLVEEAVSVLREMAGDRKG